MSRRPGAGGVCRADGTRRRRRLPERRLHRRRRAEAKCFRRDLPEGAGRHQIFHFGLAVNFAGHAQHGFFGDFLNAGGKVHMALFEHGFRRAGRTAKELMKSAIGHGEPLAIVEVIHVHPEAAVWFEIEQVFEDEIVEKGFAVRSEAHQFVFAAVDLETAVISERGIEKSKRVRKLELLQQSQFIAFAHAEGGSAPFANAIEGHDCGIFEGAGKKCAGGMTFVMVGKDETGGFGRFETLAQSATHVELVLEPERHGHPKASETGRGIGEIGFEQAIKFRQRLVVKGDVI